MDYYWCYGLNGTNHDKVLTHKLYKMGHNGPPKPGWIVMDYRESIDISDADLEALRDIVREAGPSDDRYALMSKLQTAMAKIWKEAHSE